MRRILGICIGLLALSSFSQSGNNRFQIKEFTVDADSLQLDSVSISPYNFKVLDSMQQVIDMSLYRVDFSKALLFIDPAKFKKVHVYYMSYPDFITKSYSRYDERLIVPKTTDLSKLYKTQRAINKGLSLPFDGLQTSGSILRGFTVGSNQNAVVNSNFDLQVTGNISKDVQLRASITDDNVPLQENGFSQRLDEFDRVFIEMFSKNWHVNAGDIILANTTSQFLRFQKKVAGVHLDVHTENEHSNTHFFASGALVRGQFARNTFTGQEGNQGPYRITGTQVEQFTFLISDSETVYVNGIPLKRGESNDYIIDYNTAEITFMPTFPVTANMRITVEYQYSDRNYTRFVTYNGAEYTSNRWSVGVKFYNENDVKNQSLQQDLNNSQKQLLSNAGDDTFLMVAPSGFSTVFEENKILYRKELMGAEEIYVFSNNPEDELFNVRFTYVGAHQGNYEIQTTIASGRIFEYIAPVNGVMQGSYAPIVQLVAPNKLQMGIINANYKSGKKTSITTEWAFSSNDQNLFSSIDDDDNDGFAGKIAWDQRLLEGKWTLKSHFDMEFIHQNFTTVQRYRNVEFARDWDLLNTQGNQRFLTAGLSLMHTKKGKVSYQLENLNFNNNFNGLRHVFMTDLTLNKTTIRVNSSILSNDSKQYHTDFLRLYSIAKYHLKSSWVGVKLNAEKNKRLDKLTGDLSEISHKLLEPEVFVGIGDSAKVYGEIGFNYQAVDSAQANRLSKVNTAKTYFLRAKLIQSQSSDLSLFFNYRTIDNSNLNDEESLNSRVIYRKQLFNHGISLQTAYEANSGALPQQDFNYVEVDPGLGYFTWNDYNSNGIQELDEFEIAQFQDAANYVRVLLPTINYIKINQNKWSQSLTLNASQWSSKQGLKKWFSHFVNQSFVIFDSKIKREGSSFTIHPFSSENRLVFNRSIKNSLFYNRGKQHYSITYIYLNSENDNLYSINSQSNLLKSHQLLFDHRFKKYWLFNLKGITARNTTTSQLFTSRNFEIHTDEFNPKISYLYGTNSRFEIFYHLKNKENVIGAGELLKANILGASFIHAKGRDFSVNTSVNMVIHNFEGNENSAIAYQMLEGLRPGTNFTWNLNFQKRINTYLDLTFAYVGRKSEAVQAIHTGSLQLRASF